MTFAAIIAAVSIVFPPEGAKLPNLSRCYVMGAADEGENSFRVSGFQGFKVAEAQVSRTGAWATVIDVVPGTNVIEVGGVKRTFVVEPSKPSNPSEPSKPYSKLQYASDSAKPHPTGRRPEEIGVAKDFAAKNARYAMLMRFRYNVLDFAFRLGRLDELAAAATR